MMEIETRQRINKLIEAHLDQAKGYEPTLLSNQTALKVNGADVTGAVPHDPPQYWSTLTDWKQGQLAASKDEIDARIAKSIEPGNGNNYIGRFGFLKQLFDRELLILYKKILAANIGLRELFGVNQAIPPLRDAGYLDLLVFWAQEATNALQKRFHGVDILTLVVPFHDGNGATEPPAGLGLMSHDKFVAARQTGQIPFSISESSLTLPNGGTIRNPRLRGFDFWFSDRGPAVPGWSSAINFRGSVTLPNQSSQMDFVGRPEVLSIPYVQLDHISLAPSVPDIKSYRKSYNVSPIGNWTLRLEKGLRAEDPKVPAEDTIWTIFLRLQFVYQIA
jgi:hypothetical protein